MLTKLWTWLKRVFGAEKAQTPAVAKPKRKPATKPAKRRPMRAD